jgi:TRAP-type C4-dicarboxylate transport system permease small subunit
VKSNRCLADRSPEQAAARPLATPSLAENVSESFCCGLLVAMVALVGVEAVSRNLFHVSLQVTDELGGYLLVALTFMSFSVAHTHEEFHRVNFLQKRLTPIANQILQLAFDALSLVASAIVSWQLFRVAGNSWRSEALAPTPLLTPLWIPQITMGIGMTLFCAALARTIVARIRRIRAITRRSSEPGG